MLSPLPEWSREPPVPRWPRHTPGPAWWNRRRSRSPAGRDVTVKLMVEGESGAMEEAARTVVRGGPQGAEESVRLEWVPKTLGERKLSLVIDPQEGEVIVGVIDGEAHRNRCLEGPWDRTRDHDGERAEAFADASR